MKLDFTKASTYYKKDTSKPKEKIPDIAAQQQEKVESLEAYQEEVAREHYNGCRTCKSHYSDEDDFVIEALIAMEESRYNDSIPKIDMVHVWADWLHLFSKKKGK